jgi:hypothetical protein
VQLNALVVVQEPPSHTSSEEQTQLAVRLQLLELSRGLGHGSRPLRGASEPRHVSAPQKIIAGAETFHRRVPGAPPFAPPERREQTRSAVLLPPKRSAYTPHCGAPAPAYAVAVLT